MYRMLSLRFLTKFLIFKIRLVQSMIIYGAKGELKSLITLATISESSVFLALKNIEGHFRFIFFANDVRKIEALVTKGALLMIIL